MITSPLVPEMILSRSNSQSELICPLRHRLKPMAETKNLLKQVERSRHNVL